MNASVHPFLIAVVGGSGAGKTWLVRRLQTLLGDHAGSLSLDDFYLDRSKFTEAERAAFNYDHPDAIDWIALEGVLKDCREGRSTSAPRYNFVTHSRCPEPASWHPAPLVFLDGLWLLQALAVRKLFHLTIYVDCPVGIRLWRRLRRDALERGRSPLSVWRQFFRDVLPMHNRFVAPQVREADIVLNYPVTRWDAQRLAEQLWTLLTIGISETERRPPPFVPDLLSTLKQNWISP